MRAVREYMILTTFVVIIGAVGMSYLVGMIEQASARLSATMQTLQP